MHPRIRTQTRLRTRPGLALAAGIALLIASVTPTAPVSAAIPTPGSAPYVRLFTIANNVAENETVNEGPSTYFDTLVGWYKHFNVGASNSFSLGTESQGSSSTTLATKLKNRGALVSQYRNGSYVSQANVGQVLFDEAENVEQNAPLGMGTFWPGHPSSSCGSDSSGESKLSQTINASTTTVRVTRAQTCKPASAPNTWPFRASRGSGANAGQVYSQNTHDFVSWVRVQDEIMRIKSVSGPDAGGIVTLTVDRGYFGTTAASHSSSLRAFSPVYIGSTAASGGDQGLAGSPAVDDVDKALRYGLKIWQGAAAGAKKDAIGWIADRIKATIGQGQAAPWLQGYNAVWLDVSSCFPYNNADAYGQVVVPWDDPAITVATDTRWQAHQNTKLSGLRSELSAYTGLKLLANNFSSPVGDCKHGMVQEGNYDAYVLEFWLQNTADWADLMGQHLDIQINNLKAVYWAKAAPAGMTWTQYQRWTYGSYLLGHRASATNPQFGTSWGLVKPEPATGNPFYFWALGTPLYNPTAVSNIPTISGTGGSVYTRGFANGRIMVNTQSASVTVTQGTGYYDVTSGTPVWVAAGANITIPAHDAVLLMNP